VTSSDWEISAEVSTSGGKWSVGKRKVVAEVAAGVTIDADGSITVDSSFKGTPDDLAKAYNHPVVVAAAALISARAANLEMQTQLLNAQAGREQLEARARAYQLERDNELADAEHAAALQAVAYREELAAAARAIQFRRDNELADAEHAAALQALNAASAPPAVEAPPQSRATTLWISGQFRRLLPAANRQLNRRPGRAFWTRSELPPAPVPGPTDEPQTYEEWAA